MQDVHIQPQHPLPQGLDTNLAKASAACLMGGSGLLMAVMLLHPEPQASSTVELMTQIRALAGPTRAVHLLALITLPPCLLYTSDAADE